MLLLFGKSDERQKIISARICYSITSNVCVILLEHSMKQTELTTNSEIVSQFRVLELAFTSVYHSLFRSKANPTPAQIVTTVSRFVRPLLQSRLLSIIPF